MADCKIFEDNEFLRVTLCGEIDLFNASSLKDSIKPHDSKTIIVDCNELDYIDSTGLGALVNLLKKADNFGGKVKIIGLKPHIYKLFKLTELDSIFDIEVEK